MDKSVHLTRAIPTDNTITLRGREIPCGSLRSIVSSGRLQKHYFVQRSKGLRLKSRLVPLVSAICCSVLTLSGRSTLQRLFFYPSLHKKVFLLYNCVMVERPSLHYPYSITPSRSPSRASLAERQLLQFVEQLLQRSAAVSSLRSVPHASKREGSSTLPFPLSTPLPLSNVT